MSAPPSIPRWYSEVIDLDRVRVGESVTGSAPLLFADRIPTDAAAMADERFHDREAATYEHYCRIPRVAAAERWIVPWMRRHTVAGITLDMGCGTGRVTRALASPDNRVIAVDRCLPMLDQARKDVPPGDVVLLRADARFLPVRDASIGTVVCSGVLHHLPTWQDAVAEAARVLRPGGRLIVREPNATYPAWLFAPFEQALELLVRLAPLPGPAPAEPDEETSPVETPLALPELLSTARAAGLRLLRGGTAMLLGSLGVPDAVPGQGLYYWPANVIDRSLHRFTRQPFGALLLAVFSRSGEPVPFESN